MMRNREHWDEFRNAENWSQSRQDLFALQVLGWKRNGFYIELGAGPPVSGNNTLLLAEAFDWRGLSFDVMPHLKHDWALRRPEDNFYLMDATTIDFRNFGNIPPVDYLQVDCDPPAVSLAALKNALKYFRPKVITFEHDAYIAGDACRLESRGFLMGEGYHCAVADVIAPGAGAYEDWWLDVGGRSF